MACFPICIDGGPVVDLEQGIVHFRFADGGNSCVHALYHFQRVPGVAALAGHIVRIAVRGRCGWRLGWFGFGNRRLCGNVSTGRFCYQNRRIGPALAASQKQTGQDHCSDQNDRQAPLFVHLSINFLFAYNSIHFNM